MSDVNKDPKRGASRRFRDKIKGFKLPKVSRARGRDPAPRRNSKNNKANKPAVRVKAPQLNKALEEILDSTDGNGYALWLGVDFARMVKASASVGKKDSEILSKEFKKDALKQCAELVKDESKKTEVMTLLNETKKEEKEKSTLHARDLLVETLGSNVFYSSFSGFLTEAVDSFYGKGSVPKVDEVPFRLIKSLQPGLIIYTGTDRLLEKQFQHDNIEVHSVTPLELLAFGSPENAVKQLKNISSEKMVVIKLMGDITKSESIALTRNKLLDDTEDAKFSNDLIKVLADQMPFAFIGEFFEAKDALSQLLKGEEETAEIKHVALVSELKKGQRRAASNEIGVEYITYTPDKDYTQVSEFLALMASHTAKEIPSKLGIQSVLHKAFSFETSGVDYIKGVAELEDQATTISIYTNDLTSLSFVEDALFTEQIMLPGVTAKCGNEETAKTILEAMKAREEILNKKLFGEESAARSKPIVRLLVPKQSSEVPNLECCVSKAEKLIQMLEDAQGKIELRFTDVAVKFTTDFEVLFLAGEKGLGEVVLLSDTETAHFSVNWFDQNTNEAEEKELLFERIWNVANTHTESLELLKASTEKVKAGPMKDLNEENTKGKKSKFGFFSRSKSPSKNESKSRSPSKADEVEPKKTPTTKSNKANSEAKSSPVEDEKSKSGEEEETKSKAESKPEGKLTKEEKAKAKKEAAQAKKAAKAAAKEKAKAEKAAKKAGKEEPKEEPKVEEEEEKENVEETKEVEAEEPKEAEPEPEAAEEKDEEAAESKSKAEEETKSKADAKLSKEEKAKAKKEAKERKAAEAKAKKEAKAAAKAKAKAEKAAKKEKKDEVNKEEVAEEGALAAAELDVKEPEKEVENEKEAEETEEKKVEEEAVAESKEEDTKSKGEEKKKKGKKGKGLMNKIKGMTLNRSKKKKLDAMVPPTDETVEEESPAAEAAAEPEKPKATA